MQHRAAPWAFLQAPACNSTPISCRCSAGAMHGSCSSRNSSGSRWQLAQANPAGGSQAPNALSLAGIRATPHAMPGNAIFRAARPAPASFAGASCPVALDLYRSQLKLWHPHHFLSPVPLFLFPPDSWRSISLGSLSREVVNWQLQPSKGWHWVHDRDSCRTCVSKYASPRTSCCNSTSMGTSNAS